MAKLNYPDAVAELESLGIMPDRPPSLEPVKQALQLLLPESCFKPRKTVIVAGTNGKGSICATLEALYRATGETVGLYTSPHLQETTERIRLNGQNLDKDSFAQIYHELKTRLKSIHLTHFEYLTLMAAWAFFSGHPTPPVDRAIFEVGLGGTWDATNAIPHHDTVIATLGFDHQNLLGDSIVEIARNKFGIIKSGSTVVHSPFPIEVRELKEQYTTVRWRESVPFSLQVNQNNGDPQFHIQTQWGQAPLNLPGQRGAQNTATALTFFQESGQDPAAYLDALRTVQWQGRMEKGTSKTLPCPIYYSGDHNPQGIQSLIDLLQYYPRKHLYLLIGLGREKDRDGILAPIFGLENRSVFLTENPFRGLTLENYGRWAKNATGSYAQPAQALTAIAKLAKPDDLILVTGSLYLVGFIKKLLNGTSEK